MYFARAYRNEGWLYDWEVPSTASLDDWVPALQASLEEFRGRIDGTPAEWLTRRIQMIDTDGMLSGWRVLMMMVEHEVHHRSQIDTYAGMQGWDVPQIYGRTREQIDELQEGQRERAGSDRRLAADLSGIYGAAAVLHDEGFAPFEVIRDQVQQRLGRSAAMS